MRTAVALLLVSGLVACDAPVVIPRESEAAAATRAAPARSAAADARLLAQVEAVRAELEAVPSKPADVLSSLGTLYYQAGRYTDAIDWYRQAIEAAEPALSARAALAEAGLQPADETPEGCAYTGEPGSFLAAVGRAGELARAGQGPEALACYDAALEPIVYAFSRRGGSWQIIQSPQRALADLERALSIRPDDPEALYLYGTVAFQSMTQASDREVLRRGAQRWKRLTEVAPDHPSVPQVRAALEEIDHIFSHGEGGADGEGKARGADGEGEARGVDGEGKARGADGAGAAGGADGESRTGG